MPTQVPAMGTGSLTEPAMKIRTLHRTLRLILRQEVKYDVAVQKPECTMLLGSSHPGTARQNTGTRQWQEAPCTPSYLTKATQPLTRAVPAHIQMVLTRKAPRLHNYGVCTKHRHLPDTRGTRWLLCLGETQRGSRHWSVPDLIWIRIKRWEGPFLFTKKKGGAGQGTIFSNKRHFK